MNRFGLKDEVLAFIVEAAQAQGIHRLILFGSRATGRSILPYQVVASTISKQYSKRSARHCSPSTSSTWIKGSAKS